MPTAIRHLVALFILAGFVSEPVTGQSDAHAYRLKAVFLHRFPQFVEWPETVWRDAPSGQLCVAQPNPFGAELSGLLRGESLRGRPLVTRDVSASAQLDGCHLLFVGAGASGGDALLKAARERPILTVGETDAFLRSGGMITLKLINNRVRFEVNAGAVQRAGLRMSSQLLALATNVH